MRILSILSGPAYVVAPVFFPLFVFKQVQLSINYGYTPESAYSYANYGVIQVAVANDIETAYQFGQLAYRLLERLNAKELKAKIINMIEAFVSHWKVHSRETLDPLLDGYQSGLEVGDFEFAGYCAVNYCFLSYNSGRELAGLDKEVADYTEFFHKIKQENSISYNKIFQQAILNLTGQAENPCLLIGEAYNEDKMLPVHQQKNDVNTLSLFVCIQDYSHLSISRGMIKQSNI